MSCFCLFTLFFGLLMAGVQQARAGETGRDAAMKYFTQKTNRLVANQTTAPASVNDSHQLLAIAVGSLVSSKSYGWLGEDFAGWNVEAFYLRQASRYLDQGYHLEMQKFSAEDGELTKLSFLLSFNFPSQARFPLYLGVAAGPGFFLKQQEGASEFTLDYKAYLGMRLRERNSQYFLQSGVKNHVHVLSQGQFIGWFVSSGVAYTF